MSAFLRLLLPLFVLIFSAHAPQAAPRLKTWTGNYPVTGSVTIPAGERVLLDTNLSLSDLTIMGEVVCAEQNLDVSANWIMVHGLLQCGTAGSPFRSRLNITLTGNNPAEDIMGMGTKFLGAMGGGRIVLHGEARLGWTSLSGTARRGTRQLTLKTAPPWRKGDNIVITSSDYRAGHAEEFAIQAITGNVVKISAPLAYHHWCATESYGPSSMEECAEVGLLSRNIVISGDASSETAGFGGHVMVMVGSSATISGVEFFHMGQKGKIGRYPMHWHLVGSAPGQYLDNSSIVHSYNRFLSVHGTHRLHVGGNVGYDTIGHGYYLEDGIEHGNVIEDNLGALVRNATDGKPTPSDANAAVFWISNPDNWVRRNVAAGAEHTGFWLGFPEHPISLSTTDTVWPRRTPLREFNENVSHSNGARGLFVDGAENPDRTTGTTWYEPRKVPADGSSEIVIPKFQNFVSYKNRYEGIWMRGFSRPIITGAKLADNWMGAYFASISAEGPGYIQDSLIVGETGNEGNPEDWEKKGPGGRELPHFWSPHDSIRGLEFYDGSMVVRRTRLANFQPNRQRESGALTNLSPNPYPVSSLNGASDISFTNANRVWLDPLTKKTNGDAFSAFRDQDGSISGVAHAMIVPRNPVLVTESCTRKGAWNAMICPHEYVSIQVRVDSGFDLNGTVIERNDGAWRVLGTAPGDLNHVSFHLISNRPHEVKLPFTAPNTISFIRYEKKDKAVRLYLDYPASGFTVTLWGNRVRKAGSISDLNSGGSKYFYDTAKRRLHLRLVSSNGNWEEYVVRRP